MIGSDIYDQNDGVMMLFNITSNKNFTIDAQYEITSIEVLGDGSIILLGTSLGLQAFQYNDGKA